MFKSIIITLVTLIAASAPAAGPTNTDLRREYPETFIVTEVNSTENYITLETFSGNVFIWHNSEDWMIGDIASAIMDSNGTEEVEDDEIIKLMYSGYID